MFKRLLKIGKGIGILLTILFAFIQCQLPQQKAEKMMVFVVTDNPPENIADTIYVSIDSLIDRFGVLNYERMHVVELNTDSIYQPWLIDTQGKGKYDFLAFCPEPDSKEFYRPFQLVTKPNGKPTSVLSNKHAVQGSSLIYLKDAKSYLANHKIQRWSDKLAQSVLKSYPDVTLLDKTVKYNWNYTNGFFINGLMERYQQTNDVMYLIYAESYFDQFIDDSGKIDTLLYPAKKHELDAILPGRAIIDLYKITGKEKYKTAASYLIEQLAQQPRTSDGGFWHKKTYPHQMWLDGIYMADVFMLQYASLQEDLSLRADAVNQFDLIHGHTYDSISGLLFHGWDESKSRKWANPKTGRSPEFWGRSIGWYIMALVDGLDYLPQNSPEHQVLLQRFTNLADSLSNYQDATSGLWYQVINKADSSRNWEESSCSAMFAYAFAKGFNKGYLDRSYMDKAERAFEGLKRKFIFFDEEGKLHLTGTVVVGTLNEKYSDGSFRYYTSVNRRFDDFKGLAALFYLTMELEYQQTKN